MNNGAAKSYVQYKYLHVCFTRLKGYLGCSNENQLKQSNNITQTNMHKHTFFFGWLAWLASCAVRIVSYSGVARVQVAIVAAVAAAAAAVVAVGAAAAAVLHLDDGADHAAGAHVVLHHGVDGVHAAVAVVVVVAVAERVDVHVVAMLLLLLLLLLQ